MLYQNLLGFSLIENQKIFDGFSKGNYLDVLIFYVDTLGETVSSYYPAIPISDLESSHGSCKEIESSSIENGGGKIENNISNEEEKTQSETQVSSKIEDTFEHKVDKIVEYVMVIGFHHHIGGQVNFQMYLILTD